jgi:hypothetical protein
LRCHFAFVEARYGHAPHNAVGAPYLPYGRGRGRDKFPPIAQGGRLAQTDITR